MPAPQTYKNRFDSWNDAKQEADLEIVARHGGRYTSHELLRMLAKLLQEQDGAVTSTVMDDADGYPSAQTYIDRFGSWDAAVELARHLLARPNDDVDRVEAQPAIVP